jgi:hypothetical protein
MVGVQHDKTLKINTHKGLPCGNEGFIRKLSDKVGRDNLFDGRSSQVKTRSECLLLIKRKQIVMKNIVIYIFDSI